MSESLRANHRRGVLSAPMVEAVLERLGFDDRPAADPSGLAELYEAWGQRVPWDCARKRIHFGGSCAAGPLPG